MDVLKSSTLYGHRELQDATLTELSVAKVKLRWLIECLTLSGAEPKELAGLGPRFSIISIQRNTELCLCVNQTEVCATDIDTHTDV